MVWEKYPSRRVVRNVLDIDGQHSIVQSKKNANAGYWNYADSFTYTAAGAVSSMQLGNGKWESTAFNSRLQPTRIALGTVQNGNDKLRLDYDYGTWENGVLNVQRNNGNVAKQTITVPAQGSVPVFTAVQKYEYDSLNRLQSATENIDGGQTPSWKQTFTFDRYGNRNFDTANTTTIPAGCATAVCNPQVDPATNKLIGYQFDNSGNTKIDATNRQFIYDSENKQVEVKDQYGTSIGKYFFDGDGKRVKKISATETTVFVYNAPGQLVAEYSTQISQTPQVSYLTSDHLGSPRINTDANGNVIARHDFQPFGEEIQRASYGGDTVREKFTSYERDTETDLDYAQARMYQSKLGRFNSPDPLMASAIVKSPKTWNRYVYALNNPLKYTDPDGLATKPVFKEFDKLTEDEQRILNNSTVTIGKGKNAKQLSGKDLYDALANDGNKKGNKQLANFLNQTATLSSQTFSNGRTAISYVNSVSNIEQDRITANVDAGLKTEIEKISDSRNKDDPRYEGPEDSSAFHGIYDVSFRQNEESGPQQLSFASSKEFKEADIDIDYCQKGSACHAGEVAKNTIFRTKTDPYKVYERLTQRGIQPSYTISKK